METCPYPGCTVIISGVMKCTEIMEKKRHKLVFLETSAKVFMIEEILQVSVFQIAQACEVVSFMNASRLKCGFH